MIIITNIVIIVITITLALTLFTTLNQRMVGRLRLGPGGAPSGLTSQQTQFAITGAELHSTDAQPQWLRRMKIGAPMIHIMSYRWLYTSLHGPDSTKEPNLAAHSHPQTTCQACSFNIYVEEPANHSYKGDNKRPSRRPHNSKTLSTR